MSLFIASAAMALADKPSIGKTPGQLVFDDKDGISKNFKVWNKGTETLNYTVSVSEGAKYFKVSPTTGKSRGTAEDRKHTVTVDFNEVPHGATVTGQIKITCTSANNSPQYISLTAHDAILRHIQFISIEQGIDYIPGASDENAVTGNCDGLGLAGDFDCDGFVNFSDFAFLAEQWRQTGSDMRADISPANKDGSVDINDLDAFCTNWLKDGRIGETYDFSFIIVTDNSVSGVKFTTPNDFTYPDSNVDSSRHIEANRNKNNNAAKWKFQEWFYEANGLDNYPDGKYTVKVTYTDGNSVETVVNFGIPKQAGSIAKPAQRPQFISPLNSDWIVSPLTFSWDKCTDINVNSIRLGYRTSHDSNTTEQSYRETAVKANSLKLDPGSSFADLSFGRWYQTTNDDGIPIEVGKASRNHIAFDVTKGFGAFGGLKNLKLQATDCQGKIVTFTLTGGGWCTVEGDPNIQDDCSFARIILSGTTDKSVLTITPQKGDKATIGSIESDGPIKIINARNVDLTGDVFINGSCAMIALNDISGSSNINIGSSSSPKTTCSMKLGRVNNLALTSGTPIKRLRTTEWKSGSVEAPWISSLAIDGNSASGIAGDFGANLNLSGADSPKGISLNKAKIAGQLGDSNWTVVGNCGTIAAANSSQYFDANITGNLGKLKASTLSGTWQVESVKTITAGKLMDANFTATDGIIKTLKIKGIVGEPFGIINSNVTAGYIKNAYLAFPQYSNGGTPFGLTAGKIDKVTVKDPTKTKIWKNLKTNITTGDFEIRLQ